MKKFDLVYEQVSSVLNERAYVQSTFGDNLKALIKVLTDNDLLAVDKQNENYFKTVLSQPHNVKEITLDTKEQSLPAMKLKVKQDTDSESFSVIVINLEKPDQQKEFSNSMLETIFDDVINYVKTTSLQGLAPEAAVDELPPTEGGDAQPGAEQSALPKTQPLA